jgi:uncharacterized membrane-anchored protein YjiN (DUF445 family)
LIRKYLARWLNRFPQDLPRTMPELEAFADSIIETYDLPANRSYRRMIATMIQHLPQERSRISKHKFFVAIKRAEAMECAFHKLQALKQEEAEEKQAATLKQESPPETTQGTDPGMGQETS